ncbi:MAG: response regulator [Desulfobacterales bacterium]
MSKLLLIDDEPDILRVLSKSLEADGYEVVCAQNGTEGIAVFEKEKPDIVITDIKMPSMDGIEVLKKVKDQNVDTEVIIITGHGDIENAIEALKHGASDYINKPVRDEALAIALRRAREKAEIRRQLSAYTTDLINKMKASELFPDELAADLKAALNGKKDAKDLAWRETTIESKAGESIPVRFSSTILKENERPVGTVAFFQDLREIKRLEKELLKSERLAAIGQTVAGLAHGIKNILHGLKGGSYLVDIGINRGETEKLKKGWDMIKRNIGRTSSLVMDLLSYSKVREPEFEACLPNEIAADVCALLRDKARENKVKIVKHFDNSIGEVLMDPNSVHEVLLNLMSNAVDACLFDENTDKNHRVDLKSTREKDNVIGFEITDNGIGMDEEVVKKLFTSFFSTKGHRGTGLGLMVTHKLIEEHQGTIDVKSQPGKGTTITVRLPYTQASGD